MAKRYRVGVIEGDGIGPEIVRATLELFKSIPVDLEFVELEAGYEYYRKTGKPVEEGFFDKIRELDAVLKGPLYTPPGDPTYRSINVMIRRELDLYANVRPFKSYRGFSLKDIDIVIIRENIEDVYVGIEGIYGDTAIALRIITKSNAKRIAEFAFRYAADRGYRSVAVVHKANILKVSDGLFREVFFDVAKRYPSISATEIIVDTAAYTMVKNPEKLQVLVTPNLYGDILSDLAAGIVGSLGLCGSAQIGDRIAVFEPVHGVAFDIAGKGVANPIGEILSAKMMLEYLGFKHGDEKLKRIAMDIDRAVRIVVEDKKIVTPDLGGSFRTLDVVKAVIDVYKSMQNSP